MARLRRWVWQRKIEKSLVCTWKYMQKACVCVCWGVGGGGWCPRRRGRASGCCDTSNANPLDKESICQLRGHSNLVRILWAERASAANLHRYCTLVCVFVCVCVWMVMVCVCGKVVCESVKEFYNSGRHTRARWILRHRTQSIRESESESEPKTPRPMRSFALNMTLNPGPGQDLDSSTLSFPPLALSLPRVHRKLLHI